MTVVRKSCSLKSSGGSLAARPNTSAKYASKDRPAPIIEVERIYHRNDPIILGMSPSRPPGETAYLQIIFGAALIHNDLVKNGVPDVKGVWLSTAGNRTFVTVSIKQRYPGHAKRAGVLACQSRGEGEVGQDIRAVTCLTT